MEDVVKKLKKRAKLRNALSTKVGDGYKEGQLKSAKLDGYEAGKLKSAKLDGYKEGQLKSAKLDGYEAGKLKSAKLDGYKEGQLKSAKKSSTVSNIIDRVKSGEKIDVKSLSKEEKKKVIDISDSIDDKGRYYKKQK